MSGPIKPSEVADTQETILPTAVWDAFNAEIAANFTNGSARFPQSAVVERLIASGIARREIFDCGLLNVEAAYEAHGWDVAYEKPGFNEGGIAMFVFTVA